MKYFLLLSFIIFGNLADYLSTKFALQHGAIEINPVVRRGGIGVVKTLTTFLEGIGVWFLPNQEAIVVSLLILIVLLIVSLNNVQVARALSKGDASQAIN